MQTVIAFIVAMSIIVLPPSVTSAAADGVGARGLFIQSRPKQRTQKARPRPAATVKTPATSPPPVVQVDRSLADAPIGIGLSLFRVLNQAESIRVDPASTFRAGDKLRFVVEPGIDGFLYVFVRTNGGAPVMIYPDARLEAGDNFVYAHTVTEVPSRRSRGLDIFRLTGSPAVEQVTIVLSRQPLPRVPIADALVEWCAPKGDRCTWSPEQATIDELKVAVAKPAVVSAVRDAGKKLTDDESRVLTREVVLGASDDAPTIVAVAGAVDAPVFAYELTIRHEK